MAMLHFIPEGACTNSLAQVGQASVGGGSWQRRHWSAWMDPDGVERAVRDLIVALARYGNEHRAAHGAPTGNDGYIGPIFKAMLHHAIDLLNGDLRRFDGGTLDRLLREIAKENGIELDE